jgi:dTDP-4-amino-4,6-dideoxygalactose transaminase
MEKICAIAEKYAISIVEDNAQSQGSACNGKFAGSFGHINATSFYPTKNLGAIGDAGAITTNNTQLAQFARTFRNYGSQKKYYNEIVGANSRLDELQAAILLSKLKHLQKWNERRAYIANYYTKNLAGVGDIILPKLADGCTSVWHLYVIQTDKREQFIQHLQKHNIATSIHYPVPPHLQQAYNHLGYKKGDFPIAEKLAEKVLSLPVYPEMTDEQCAYVCDKTIDFFNQ